MFGVLESCFSFHRRFTGGWVYEVVGPFPDYTQVSWMDVSWHAQVSAHALAFGASVGVSNEASLEAFGAGRPLITSSVHTSAGIPCWRQAAEATSRDSFKVPVGVVGSSGSRYIVCALYTDNTTDPSEWFVATWLGRRVRHGKVADLQVEAF